MASEWVLALEQNQKSEVTQGSSAATAEAVRNGADLRLFLIAQGYEETLYFQQTYVGEKDTFAGLMTHHHSYQHRGSLAEQPYFSLFKYDTSGSFSQAKWMLDNRTFDEPQPYPYGVYRWFVCDRWRVVYEHDADGNCVSGDLDKLKEHLRTGRTLKVSQRAKGYLRTLRRLRSMPTAPNARSAIEPGSGTSETRNPRPRNSTAGERKS